MKLLLTSSGITNKSIADAVLELAGKPAKEIKLIFITTAANVKEGDKDWLINDLKNCQKQGYKSIDIMDFSGLPREAWEPRLRVADVMLFGGGDSYYLMDQFRKSGLDKLLQELLETRVYVGISAGSRVVSSSLKTSGSAYMHREGVDEANKEKALGFTDFLFIPHLNSPHFPERTEEAFKKVAEEVDEAIYVADDDTAIKVVDGEIEVVSEGKWVKL